MEENNKSLPYALRKSQYRKELPVDIHLFPEQDQNHSRHLQLLDSLP